MHRLQALNYAIDLDAASPFLTTPDGQTVPLSWRNNLLVANTAELTMLGAGDRVATENPSVWHGRLSHLSHNTMTKIARHCTGIPILPPQSKNRASHASNPRCSSAPYPARPPHRLTPRRERSKFSLSTSADHSPTRSTKPSTTSSSSILYATLPPGTIIYMRPPFPYDRRDYVLLLIKSLYGLRQAGNLYYRLAHDTNRRFGLNQSLYCRASGRL